MTKIDNKIMGDVWPLAHPGEDPVLYGSVKLTPSGSFEARSLQTFTLVYTAGRFGLDDTGAIKIVHRYPNDWGGLQMSDPHAANYVTAISSNGARLKLEYQAGGEQRPWYRSLTITVKGNGLYEGDTLTIVFGDRSAGSPGLKLQTFCESSFEFKVLADVCATGHFYPVSNTPSIAIVPGSPDTWKAVLPSLRRPGEVFRLGIKAEDKWGNPTSLVRENLHFNSTLAVQGLSEKITYGPDKRAITIDNLVINQEGVLRISISNDDGVVLTESNPMVIRAGDVSGYWADMHGQSGESVGVNTALEYFDFARNLSFLDATSHQANDFQVNNTFWNLINELTAKYQEDHRFVTYPGYEWSGNTAVGGDRNVYFRTEGQQIRRSSHALLPDRSDINTDANTAEKLFNDLQGSDCIVYAHIGGRPADIKQAHDPKLETAMEIHSAWGTFEWLLTDGFELGHRCGVVCNSDGHKGRPGASYPGASSFGAYGGLTCFLTNELTRDSLFDCLRRRHHYGTTGTRMHLDVRAKFKTNGNLYERDPRYFDVEALTVDEVMMGDIAQTNDEVVDIFVECLAHAPIERIDIMNGKEIVKTLRNFGENDLGNRVRIIWQGAEYRGRGRQTNWKGSAKFHGRKITNLTLINAWNHERKAQQETENLITWDSLTTGNFGGFDVCVENGETGRLDIKTNHVAAELNLQDVGLDDIVLQAGGLDRCIRVFRLPLNNNNRELQATEGVTLKTFGDNQIWVRVTTEDGFNAWSSPIFLYR